MNAAEPVRNASVLLGFRAENTRSFRDEFELSMLATRLADEDAVRYVTWREDGRPVGILPLASVFGANASARNFVLAEESTRQLRQALTAQLLNDDGSREPVLALLRAAAMGITGAKTQPLDPITGERIQKAVRILAGLEIDADGTGEGPHLDDLGLRLLHRGADSDVDLDPHDESFGTLVWFGLVGSVIEALAQGTVLLADELDASLHPNLVRQLICLFQNPESNPRQAQLVFNSHDMTILGDSASDRVIGRDQIWFTEKGNDGCSSLYSLADLEPRKSEAIGRRYLAGHYGATPNLSSQEFEAAARLVGSGDHSKSLPTGHTR